jgi:hypothetical protein
MSGPWSLISMIVNAGSKNMSQTEQGANKSESETYGVYKKNPQQGMVYNQAPAMASGAESPTAQIMQGMGAPVQFQKQQPIVGAALKGEQAMLRNTQPAVGGYMQGPATVDSGQPAYNDSGLPDYLKKRGGFSL